MFSILPLGSIAVRDMLLDNNCYDSQPLLFHKLNKVLCLAVTDCCRCVITRLNENQVYSTLIFTNCPSH